MVKTKILASIVTSLFAPVLGILLNRQNTNYQFLEFDLSAWALIALNVGFSTFCFFVFKSKSLDVSILQISKARQLLYTLIPAAIAWEMIRAFKATSFLM